MTRRRPSILSKKKRYLQIALNSTMNEALGIIATLPPSDRIIVEAGTPFIKRYGTDGIRAIRHAWGSRLSGVVDTQGKPILPYVIADMKTMDRGETEVALAGDAGASAVIALGSAPIETLNAFITACDMHGLDSMIDMMNVEVPLTILRALKNPPHVIVLHRGVDEERDNRAKSLPLHEIRRLKGSSDILIAVAGGDTPREVASASFNDADIVVVWKSVFERNEKTIELVNGFLKDIK